MKRLALLLLVCPLITRGITPGYLNADSVCIRLTNSPLHYYFTLTGTGPVLAHYSGYESKEVADNPMLRANASMIDVAYNPRTKEIFAVTFYMKVSSDQPKKKEAAPLFEFYKVFDEAAAAYFKKNYSSFIKMNDDEIKPYEDKTNGLNYLLDPSKLYKNREREKQEPAWKPGPGEREVVAEVDRVQ